MIKLNKEELTQKLLSYNDKIESGCIHVAKSKTEYNTLDNYLIEMEFSVELNITKFKDGNIRIIDGGSSSYIIEMDRFKEAHEYMEYKQYCFIKPHRLITVELTNGNIIHFYFRDINKGE